VRFHAPAWRHLAGLLNELSRPRATSNGSLTGVSVIIPARDAAATISDTLSGLEHQDFAPEFEVIVVDDGSRDATVAIAQASPVVSSVIRQDGGGPAAARNAGAAAASGGRLAFIDADCRATTRWLAAGTAALDGSELVLGRTLPPPDDPPGPFDRTLWVNRLSPLFESANLFVTRTLFDALDGFESWLGPKRGGKELGEDVWFGWRARRAGARIDYCPEALAYHAVFTRSAAGFVSERWRLRFFPPMARRIPELREAFFYKRWFLSRRSAAFDAALAGAAFARAGRRPLALLAMAPYARILAEDAREHGWPAGVSVAGARLAADAVGAAAMAYGSARSRSLLL
jgi:glycosyltransferase involved in cell wall biosynthesis